MSQGTILLVDDDPQIKEGFGDSLESEGYTVDTAYSGEEGWEKYQKRYYDLVITGLMQKIDGMELLKKIDNTYPFSKVIMITAYRDEQTVIEAHHYHPFDYLIKPVDIKDLLQVVKEAMQRRDGIITAMEDWVETHPEESTKPLKAVEDQVWSAKDALDEIKSNTERGRQEYQKIINLTVHLLTRGKIKN